MNNLSLNFSNKKQQLQQQLKEIHLEEEEYTHFYEQFF